MNALLPVTMVTMVTVSHGYRCCMMGSALSMCRWHSIQISSKCRHCLHHLHLADLLLRQYEITPPFERLCGVACGGLRPRDMLVLGSRYISVAREMGPGYIGSRSGHHVSPMPLRVSPSFGPVLVPLKGLLACLGWAVRRIIVPEFSGCFFGSVVNMRS